MGSRQHPFPGTPFMADGPCGTSQVAFRLNPPTRFLLANTADAFYSTNSCKADFIVVHKEITHSILHCKEKKKKKAKAYHFLW